MSALYLKYRPQELDEIVGNKGAVASLRSLLERDRDDMPHSFLFAGASGCGKTTMARIMAKKLGCAEADVFEVDTADFRGIETIRDIRRKMILSPIGGGKARAWILDECHQLSKDAQSALLKALEDTPRHVFFFLCTTDPQKLLPTIRNRCTQINVATLSEKELVMLMMRVCRSEKKKVPRDVLALIAEEALGSARAALVVLDRIIDLPPEEMKEAAKGVMVEESEVIELCRLLAKDNVQWKAVAKVLGNLRGKADPEQIRRAVQGYMTSVLLRSGNPNAYITIASFNEPTYNSGFAGVVKAAYEAVHSR